ARMRATARARSVPARFAVTWTRRSPLSRRMAAGPSASDTCATWSSRTRPQEHAVLLALAPEDVGDGAALVGELHGLGDVGGIEAVARGRGAVHGDRDLRDPARGLGVHVHDPGGGGHGPRQAGLHGGEGIEVVAHDAHGEGRARLAEALLDALDEWGGHDHPGAGDRGEGVADPTPDLLGR